MNKKVAAALLKLALFSLLLAGCSPLKDTLDKLKVFDWWWNLAILDIAPEKLKPYIGAFTVIAAAIAYYSKNFVHADEDGATSGFYSVLIPIAGASGIFTVLALLANAAKPSPDFEFLTFAGEMKWIPWTGLDDLNWLTTSIGLTLLWPVMHALYKIGILWLFLGNMFSAAKAVSLSGFRAAIAMTAGWLSTPVFIYLGNFVLLQTIRDMLPGLLEALAPINAIYAVLFAGSCFVGYVVIPIIVYSIQGERKPKKEKEAKQDKGGNTTVIGYVDVDGGTTGNPGNQIPSTTPRRRNEDAVDGEFYPVPGIGPDGRNGRQPTGLPSNAGSHAQNVPGNGASSTPGGSDGRSNGHAGPEEEEDVPPTMDDQTFSRHIGEDGGNPSDPGDGEAPAEEAPVPETVGDDAFAKQAERHSPDRSESESASEQEAPAEEAPVPETVGDDAFAKQAERHSPDRSESASEQEAPAEEAPVPQDERTLRASSVDFGLEEGREPEVREEPVPKTLEEGEL